MLWLSRLTDENTRGAKTLRAYLFTQCNYYLEDNKASPWPHGMVGKFYTQQDNRHKVANIVIL